MVDYILYTGKYSLQLKKPVEGKLKLLSKLSLPSASEIEKMGRLPTPEYPSDHLSLAAKFLLT